MRWFSLMGSVAACLFISMATSAGAEETPAAPPKYTFEDDIKPIFRAKCFNCHNTDKKVAGLDLTGYTSMMQGGGSGSAVEPGDPSVSYLWMVVAHETEPYMPPNSPRMEESALNIIKEWIEIGAPENKGSKVVAKKKVDLSLSGVPTGRPEGPPPMPTRLSLAPQKHTSRSTAVTALAASPWAPLVAVGGFNQVCLYNTETMQLVGVLPFPEGSPSVLRFSRNGKILLGGGGRGAYRGLCVLWDVTTGERITEIGDEVDEVLAADISPGQDLVALGNSSKKVKVFSVQTGEMLYEIKKHTDWIYAIEFSPDGVLLATGDRSGGLHVWEAISGQEFLTLDGHKTPVNSVSWRPDSNLFGSCDESGKVYLWELENGKSVKNWTAHGGGVKAMEFTRDGGVVTCGVDKTAKLWDGNGAQKKQYPAFGDIALRVTYVGEGDKVVAGDWSGSVKVWDAKEGKELGILSPNPPELQTRVDEALALVSTSTKAQESAQAKTTAAEAAVGTSQKALDQAKADLATAEKAKAEAEATGKRATVDAEASKKQQAEAAAQAAKVAGLLPPLTSAAEQLAKALAVEKESADLKQAQAAISAAIAARQQQVDAAKASEKQAAEKVAALQKQAEQAAAAAKTAAGQLDGLKKAVVDREAELKAKQAELAAAKQEVSKAETELKSAQAALTRWQDELAYSRQTETVSTDATATK